MREKGNGRWNRVEKGNVRENEKKRCRALLEHPHRSHHLHPDQPLLDKVSL